MVDIYSTNEMLKALPSLRMAPQFFQDTFFPGVVNSDREEVDFDLLDDELRLAPLVSPLVEAKVMKMKSYQTSSIKPAYVKPLFALDPKQPLRRDAGEAVGGSMSAKEREAAILARGLMNQRDMILRRIEVMCADFLKTGKITLSGEDYDAVVLDFGRASGQTIALTDGDRWGQSAVSPYDDLDSWIDTMATAVGAAATDVVFGKSAWALYIADDKVKNSIDRTLGQGNSVELGQTARAPGKAVWKGRQGTVDLWMYNDTYIDENGDTQTLIDNNHVIGVANEAAVGTQGYGAIVDPASGFAAVSYFPTSWLEPNPGRRMLMTQSSPIPFFGRPNASFCAKVQ
ncbi:MAG: major capsid protein [Alphaproteobacteria bacterium]|nr:major capsid protein [Alphaproteobacteria bacterium]